VLRLALARLAAICFSVATTYATSFFGAAKLSLTLAGSC
jgi:hypothetical protein